MVDDGDEVHRIKVIGKIEILVFRVRRRNGDIDKDGDITAISICHYFSEGD
jgi:hypothetical protein